MSLLIEKCTEIKVSSEIKPTTFTIQKTLIKPVMLNGCDSSSLDEN
jgi:hypothetical protein